MKKISGIFFQTLKMAKSNHFLDFIGKCIIQLFGQTLFQNNHHNQSKMTWLPSIWYYELHSGKKMSGNILSSPKNGKNNTKYIF